MMTKANGLPILTYHAIDPSGAVTATDPARFAETLDALGESGHRAVDLGDWVAAGRPDLALSFAICFDDGLASILDVADLLVRHAIPATVFLVSDRIGRDNAWPGQPLGIPRARLLDRSELAALADRGFRFGSHGRTHARLDRLSAGELEDDLRGSRIEIEQALGRPCPLLAYPYGASNDRVRRGAAGVYDAAFGTRMAYGRAGEDRSDISRIDAYYLRRREPSGRSSPDVGDPAWRSAGGCGRSAGRCRSCIGREPDSVNRVARVRYSDPMSRAAAELRLRLRLAHGVGVPNPCHPRGFVGRCP